VVYFEPCYGRRTRFVKEDGEVVDRPVCGYGGSLLRSAEERLIVDGCLANPGIDLNQQFDPVRCVLGVTEQSLTFDLRAGNE
jgi:hypothetical protein